MLSAGRPIDGNVWGTGWAGGAIHENDQCTLLSHHYEVEEHYLRPADELHGNGGFDLNALDIAKHESATVLN